MMTLAKTLNWIHKNAQAEIVHLHSDSLISLTYVTKLSLDRPE